MLQTNHYELLDRLRFGKNADDRKEAMRELVYLEHEAKIEKSDIFKLLNDKDPVIQVYAIGAIGRMQLSFGIPELKRRYLESTDPLILDELLTAFQQFESDDFLDIVLEKLRKLSKKPWLFQRRLSKSEGPAKNQFLLDQVLIPSLKYIRANGNTDVEKIVKPYLKHEDGNVRWQTLKLYDALKISIKPEVLQEMAKTDTNPLVREQADILMAKQK